jgi:DNA-binding MarR family transcriptional regulator
MRTRFVYLLSIAHRRVQSWMQAEHPDATAAQAGVLFVLGKKPGAGVGDVARGLSMGLPGASGLVDRMVESRLIERRPDERDGRSWRLFLTKSGEAMRVVAQAATAEINARLVAGFSESELEIVARWLNHVGNQFSKENRQ